MDFDVLHGTKTHEEENTQISPMDYIVKLFHEFMSLAEIDEEVESAKVLLIVFFSLAMIWLLRRIIHSIN